MQGLTTEDDEEDEQEVEQKTGAECNCYNDGPPPQPLSQGGEATYNWRNEKANLRSRNKIEKLMKEADEQSAPTVD